ncbi:unnamed protein product [Trichogramma brassicae]|uniref:Uncharacterized protein n=1 Tax=Trichogramma brassicae TaxID=86971 RepID=A0A6H5IL50_9HYME|nr:unnamed protein product [Trichogramma brassicae]
MDRTRAKYIHKLQAGARIDTCQARYNITSDSVENFYPLSRASSLVIDRLIKFVAQQNTLRDIIEKKRQRGALESDGDDDDERADSVHTHVCESKRPRTSPQAQLYRSSRLFAPFSYHRVARTERTQRQPRFRNGCSNSAAAATAGLHAGDMISATLLHELDGHDWQAGTRSSAVASLLEFVHHAYVDVEIPTPTEYLCSGENEYARATTALCKFPKSTTSTSLQLRQAFNCSLIPEGNDYYPVAKFHHVLISTSYCDVLSEMKLSRIESELHGHTQILQNKPNHFSLRVSISLKTPFITCTSMVHESVITFLGTMITRPQATSKRYRRAGVRQAQLKSQCHCAEVYNACIRVGRVYCKTRSPGTA